MASRRSIMKRIIWNLGFGLGPLICIGFFNSCTPIDQATLDAYHQLAQTVQVAQIDEQDLTRN